MLALSMITNFTYDGMFNRNCESFISGDDDVEVDVVGLKISVSLIQPGEIVLFKDTLRESLFIGIKLNALINDVLEHLFGNTVPIDQLGSQTVQKPNESGVGVSHWDHLSVPEPPCGQFLRG
ncbi:hypothetical protein WICPIJ_002880 [Wickerhamomyces pijperi]|uniref:Uncharacterized protein n=1 Tax=Wickerhamomyces pijperi TaxID=599730 RepID=A0A9P8QAT0_WICPI|nr:hypothetical protein WICPIJ_002880 [Wickerhamomyces pijperi]